jgi:hypothetical protein
MNRSASAALVLLASALAASGLAAEDASFRRYELPNRDTLELSIPAGWVDHVEQPAGGGPPTLEFATTEGGPRQVFVRPDWADPTAKDVRELPMLRDAIRDLAERTRGDASEGYLEIRQLNGTNGVGYYFSATLREPGEDGFKFLSQGALQVGSLTLWFDILTNEGQDTVALEAFTMLQTAVHRRTGLDQL